MKAAPPVVAAPVAAPVAAMKPVAVTKVAVAVIEEEAAPVATEAPPSPALLTSAMRELRASIRGRQLPELASGIGASTEETMKVCGALMAQGQIVRRGLKYFVA
jgi:hypothetical protein